MTESIKYKDYTINIDTDDDAPHPRQDQDNLGVMYCVDHRRYGLGDKQMTQTDIAEFVADDNNIMLPVYMFEHSGIALSVTPFSCKWDSGQIGIIFMSKQTARDNFASDTCHLDDDIKQRAIECMTAEIDEYSAYLNGDCYCYSIDDPNGDETPYTGYGYIGTDHEKSGMLVAARDDIDFEIKQRFPLLAVGNLLEA